MSTPATYLEYSDREHRYFADGKELRSVTQVLDAAGLISQFCKDDEAAARGTEVHRLCASMMKSAGSSNGAGKLAWLSTGLAKVPPRHRIQTLSDRTSRRLS
jgi:hypothetical protein